MENQRVDADFVCCCIASKNVLRSVLLMIMKRFFTVMYCDITDLFPLKYPTLRSLNA